MATPVQIILFIIAIALGILLGYNIGLKRGKMRGFVQGQMHTNEWWKDRLPKEVFDGVFMNTLKEFLDDIIKPQAEGDEN